MTAFILVLVALVLTAMLLGVHLSGVFGLNPAMNALDFDLYLRTKQSFDVVMPRFARPLMLGALISTAVATFVAILQLGVGASLACGGRAGSTGGDAASNLARRPADQSSHV